MKTLLAGLILTATAAVFGQYAPSAFLAGREYPSLKLKNGAVYEKVRVLYLSEAEIRIMHQNGTASVPLSELTPADLARTGFANPTAKTGGMSRIMSPADRARTGIDKLNHQEQESLQNWIIRAADGYLHHLGMSPEPEIATTSPPAKPPALKPQPRKKSPIQMTSSPPQPSIRKAVRLWAHGAPLPSHGHYIVAKFRGQNPKIQLDDDSLWEVSPREYYTMFRWMPTDDISLVQGDDATYPVTMVNTDHGRSVNVKLLSQ
ncbi:MAG: hypothetical protein U0984_10285 [Prosthecobacter sp.]|nr:hypothetical protein [Prosthecobacter sp.]